MAKAVKLTIFLVKEGLLEKELLKESYKILEVEPNGKFYTEMTQVRPPSWISDFFQEKLDLSFLKVASSKGVYIVPVNISGQVVQFAICFGTGRHMLKDDVYEERFGLKVTLNSIDPESLRSIEKSTIGAISKQTKEQLSKASKASVTAPT